MGLGDGTGALQDLAQLDQLSDQISQSHQGARLDDVDLDALAGQLGPEAAVAAKTLQELERALRDSGYLKRGSDGELRLSPKAMRQLGKALLRDVADRMSGRSGARETRTTGLAGEPSGASRQWEFGDTEPWDVSRTITNAVLRDQICRWSSSRRGTSRRIETPDPGRRHRGRRDRGPHPGGRRAPRGHVVLDGDGRAVGADEADRPGPAPAGALALPGRRPAADRLRPPRPGDGGRGAHRAGRALGQGHQPPPRPAAREPVLPQAPQRPAGAPRGHRRRADRAPRARRRGLVLLSAAPADDRPLGARARRGGAARRAGHLLPARRGPRPGPLHRLDGAPRRRPDGEPRARRPRRRGRRVLPRLPRTRERRTANSSATSTAVGASGSRSLPRRHRARVAADCIGSAYGGVVCRHLRVPSREGGGGLHRFGVRGCRVPPPSGSSREGGGGLHRFGVRGCRVPPPSGSVA